MTTRSEPILEVPLRKPSDWNILVRCFKFLRPYWHLALGTYLTMLIITALTLTIPQFIRWIVDRGIGEGNLSLLGWSVAWFPFLKYPANPPGVGEAETVGYRQTLYVGFIGLSIVGTALALGLSRLLRPSSGVSAPAQRGGLGIMAAYFIYAALIYVVFPANPDPVEMPADLVWSFRLISFAGLIVFWISLGGLFGWLARDPARALAAR